MKIAKVIDETSNDWVGLYVDGKLASQDHSIQEEDLISYLIDNEIKFSKEDKMEIYYYDRDLDGEGFPVKFEDLDSKQLAKCK